MVSNIVLSNLTTPPTPGTSSPIIGTRSDLRGGVRGGGGGGGPTPDGLFDLSTIQYLGAFLIPPMDVNGHRHRIGFNPPNGSNGTYGSIWSSGSVSTSGSRLYVAEYQIPASLSDPSVNDPSLLSDAVKLQDYVSAYDLTGGDGYSVFNDYMGMLSTINGKLFMGCSYSYNGSNGDNLNQWAVFDDPTDIANSTIYWTRSIGGFDQICQWCNEIPSDYKSVLGGDYLTGGATGQMSRTERLSFGPALYRTALEDYTLGDSNVPHTEYMMFKPSQNPMPRDLFPTPAREIFRAQLPCDGYNQLTAFHYFDQLGITTEQEYTNWCLSNPRTEFNTLTYRPDSIVNDLWNFESEAATGFIVPGSRTYLVVGTNGGLRWGAGYKAYEFDRTKSEGPSPLDSADKDQYYWAFDMDEILAAANPYDVLPYDRGIWQSNIWKIDQGQFNQPIGLIMNGFFDNANRRLYLSHARIPKPGSTISKSTLVSVYQF